MFLLESTIASFATTGSPEDVVVAAGRSKRTLCSLQSSANPRPHFPNREGTNIGHVSIAVRTSTAASGQEQSD